MGIFAKLFQKTEPDFGPVMKKWLQMKLTEKMSWEQHHKKTWTMDPEDVIFTQFVGAVSLFLARCEPKNPSQENDIFSVSKAEFGNSAVLFELGCYGSSQVDRWLSLHRPDLRERISRVFRRDFVDLFAQVLRIQEPDELARLVDGRIRNYGRLVQAGAEVSESYYHLYRLIMKARGNKTPQDYDFDSTGFYPGGFTFTPAWVIDNMALLPAIVDWEVKTFPLVVDRIEKVADTLEN